MTARKRDLTGEPRLLLDYQLLAHALSISVAQAKELAADGQIVKVKIGSRVLFDVEDVKTYIKRIKEAA